MKSLVYTALLKQISHARDAACPDTIDYFDMDYWYRLSCSCVDLLGSTSLRLDLVVSFECLP